MRIGFLLRSLTILVLVVIWLPQLSRAQDNGLPSVSLPPLPPLPGVTPPVAAAPKLPQLKTIPEIPPAKQVAAGAPAEKGWMDKLKDWVAEFENKSSPAPATLRVAQATPPPLKPIIDNTKPTLIAPKMVLTPPPPMEPPVVDALNLGSETPVVDPNVFEFDDTGKTKKRTKISGPSVIPPLPPMAKKNSSEPISVPVLPNTVKPDKLAQYDLSKLPPIPELKPLPTPPVAPSPAPLAAIPAPALPAQAIPGLPPLKPQIATTQKMPVLAGGAPAEKGWLDTLKEKAHEASKAIMAKVESIKTPSKTTTASNEKGWFDSLKESTMGPAEQPPANSVKYMKPKLDILEAKNPPLPPLPVPPAQTAVVTAPTIPPIPTIPMVPTIHPLPKPEIAAAIKAPALPAIQELQPLPLPKAKMPFIATKAPEVAAIPTIQPLPVPKAEMPVLAAKTPEIPSIPTIQPLPKPQIASGTPTSAFPSIPEMQPLPLPKPGMPQMAAKTPALPAIPAIPAIPSFPKSESAQAKIPQIPSIPTTSPTAPALPPLALDDLKLPGDRAKPSMPKIVMATPPAKPKPNPSVKPNPNDVFEFGELNDKGKKAAGAKANEPVIADISKDDPSFKFWKGHDFRTQVLPDVINRKEYETRNSHLPKALYKEDLEQLLFVAIGRGDLNAIRALLNNGVDVEAKNAIGDTPLVHAAINGQAGAVRVLLARGANPNLPNVHGFTAMQVAAEHGREDIIDALFEMGAKSTADYRNPMTPLQSGVTRGFASVYNAMLDGENPKKKELDARDRALQALADAGPSPRTVISQGQPGLSKQIIDDEARKKPGEPLTFDEIERKLAYQDYVRKTGDDPAANGIAKGTVPKIISPAGATASPVPIPYASPQPAQSQNPPPPPGYIPPSQQEPIVGLPPEPKPQ